MHLLPLDQSMRIQGDPAVEADSQKSVRRPGISRMAARICDCSLDAPPCCAALSRFWTIPESTVSCAGLWGLSMEKSIFSQNYGVFLQHLRRIRKQAGLTQEQLASRLGQTQSFVSKCERGERRLDLVEVREFCKAIGVSFASFAADFDKKLTRR
jgi:DNA-binding XRE family transcriptional regulator